MKSSNMTEAINFLIKNSPRMVRSPTLDQKFSSYGTIPDNVQDMKLAESISTMASS